MMHQFGSHERASTINAREFVNMIRVDIEKNAYCAIPFIGAGFSVPAGIPAAQQISRYQTYCFLRALGINPFLENSSPHSIREKLPFDLRSGVLPDMAEEMLCQGRVISTEDLLHCLNTASAGENKEEAIILQLAKGAIAEWRTALDLLSRIEPHLEGGKWSVRRSVPEATVVDAFFRHLSRYRSPSLGHRLLPSLCTLCRSHVILSTNFDTLIEDAFRAVDHPLSVFPVPLPAALPGAPLVLAQRSLVKLHGSAHGLWANDAIDRTASEADRENFLAYLSRSYSDPDQIHKEPHIALIVIGQSGSDRRTQYLLRAALDRFETLRIYWICYTEWDVRGIQASFRRADDSVKTRVHYLRHQHHEHLLLQLYQALSSSIPSAGVIVPALWELPTPAEYDVNPPDEKQTSLRGEIIGAIRTDMDAQQREPTWIESASDRMSVVVCAELCVDGDKHFPRTRKVWLDLENIVEPVGLFLRLSSVLSRIQGDADPICTLDVRAFDKIGTDNPIPDNRFFQALESHLMEVYARSGEQTIAFVNCFDGVGIRPLFATDAPSRTWENTEATARFVQVIKDLNRSQKCGIQFVFITGENNRLGEITHAKPRTNNSEINTPQDSFESLRKLKDALRDEGLKAFKQKETFAGQYAPAAAAESAIKFCNTLPADNEINSILELRPQFLYLLIAFQIARYPAGIIRVFHSFVAERHWKPQREKWQRLSTITTVCNDWLDKLQAKKVIYAKEGDFYVMDYLVKDSIRSKLEVNSADRLHIESLIARWYGRMLLGSANPLAATQSIEHSLHAVTEWITNPTSNVNDIVSAQRIPMILDHARLVFDAAKTLWRQRLSDQFATRALIGLRKAAARSEEAIKTSGFEEPIKSRCRSRITKFLLEIRRFECTLALEEGEYENVLEMAEPRCEPHVEDEATFHARLESAIAKLCLRRYADAETDLKSLWKDLDGPRIGDKEPTAAAREWLYSPTDKNRSPEKQRWLARLSRTWVYYSLHKSQSVYCANRVMKYGDEEERKRALQTRHSELFGCGLWAAHFGLELLRGDQGESRTFVFEENVRLRTHAALCVGIMDFCSTTAQAQEHSHRMAESYLTDAEAYIDEFPIKEAGLNRVILELRRAELQLLRINQDGQFRELRKATRSDKKVVPPPNATCATRLDDTFRHLERAADELRRHPKSRWWWWIYCALKMKAVEYLFLIKFDRDSDDSSRDGEHEPRHVLEEQSAAFYDAITFFNGALETAVRRSALTDCFQLARIVESYHNCLVLCEAQHQRLNLDRMKQVDIRRNLQTLEWLTLRLESLPTDPAVDNNVKLYTDTVKGMSRSRIEESKTANIKVAIAAHHKTSATGCDQHGMECTRDFT